MTGLLLVLPVLAPLAATIASLMAWTSLRAQRMLAIVGTGVQLIAAIALLVEVWQSGTLAVQAGDWTAPFGISFVADHLSASMVVITGIIGFGVAVYALGSLDHGRERFGFYPLYHLLLMAVAGAFLTGDIFNLYVWFEVMLSASFVLLVLGNGREQIRGALTYVAINLVSSAVFLAAVGLLYGATGTLNMADLAIRIPEMASPGMVTTLSMLFLIVFGVKAAVFPLFFWLPAAYHAPPVAVSAVFAGLLTKVGVYALLRVFSLLFTADVPYTHGVILVVAGLTMVTGVLGAAAQTEVRKILSFHIISQIGYMVMGLGLFTRHALAGSVFYILHHIIVKTNLFLVSGLMRRVGGSFELDRLGGLFRSKPLLALLFAVPAFSLAGLPPLSGFWAKLYLVQAGLAIDQYLIVGVALAVGLLTMYSMTKIWSSAFWKPAPADAAADPEMGSWTMMMRSGSPSPQGTAPPSAASGASPVPGSAPAVAGNHATSATGTAAGSARTVPGSMLAPVIVLAALTLLIGLWAQPLAELASRAAADLVDPERYVQAVFDARGVR